MSFIRDDEVFDKDTGAFTERGYAKIALIGADIEQHQRNIVAAEAAMEKYNVELGKGIINEETYKELIKEQTDYI